MFQEKCLEINHTFQFCTSLSPVKSLTSAQAWCTGKTQRDRVEREIGGGIGMGGTSKSMADSCKCMAKATTIL